MMEQITRQRFQSWNEMRRLAWQRWFEEHGLSLDDIADFTINEDDAQVEVRVFLKNEDGKPYPHPELRNEAAWEIVTLPVDAVDASLFGDRKPRHVLLLPPYS